MPKSQQANLVLINSNNRTLMENSTFQGMQTLYSPRKRMNSMEPRAQLALAEAGVEQLSSNSQMAFMNRMWL
jgi:hypothetical protein